MIFEFSLSLHNTGSLVTFAVGILTLSGSLEL